MKNGKSCYVEWDSYAANWLRNLISRGLIADGVVRECSVVDVVPNELAEFSQVHLYAGIGVWSYSLRRAGIPDTANIWTFSEPCQPFSAAGKGLGFADDRYLRPYTNHLIEQCRPAICLGEQVASNDGLGWLDVVQTDMERARYACGALDTCSAGFGAPHIRQRLRVAAVAEEWLADAEGFGRRKRFGNVLGATSPDKREMARQGNGDASWSDCAVGQLVHAERTGLEGLGRYVGDGDQSGRFGAHQAGHATAPGCVSGLADASHERFDGKHALLQRQEPGRNEPDLLETTGRREADRLVDAASLGRGERGQDVAGCGERSGAQGLEQRFGNSSVRGIGDNSAGRATNGHWADADWLFCRDGKWRPVEPGTFPLVNGAASRVGRLRAYGNAVDAEATTDFCRNVAEVLGLI